MCNAWNHPPSCNCGWGGDTGNYGYGLSRFNNEVNLSSPFPTSLYQTALDKTLNYQLRSAETRHIPCWWCKLLVYYHTNGYGDSVLFDRLGHPWLVHKCWKEHCQRQRQQNFGSSQVSDQTRLAILIGVLRQMSFAPNESSVASRMGISIRELRETYGLFYSIDQYTKEISIRSDFSDVRTTDKPKLEVLEIRRPIKKKKPTVSPLKKHKKRKWDTK